MRATIGPGTIISVWLNDAAHEAGRGATRKTPTEPMPFIEAGQHGDRVQRPDRAGHPVHETRRGAELVVVIGKATRQVALADAPKRILGYTCGNDVFDRVPRRRDGPFAGDMACDSYPRSARGRRRG